MADEKVMVEAFSNFQANATLAKVQMSVAKKVLDQQRMDGAAAIELLNAAAKTMSAGKGDALVAAATGLGGNLDMAA